MASHESSFDEYLEQISDRYRRLAIALKEAEEDLRARPSRLIEVRVVSYIDWQEAWAWQSREGLLGGEILLRGSSTEPLGELVFKFASGEIELEDLSFYIYFHDVRGKAKFEKEKKLGKVIAEAPFLYSGQSLAEVSLSIVCP